MFFLFNVVGFESVEFVLDVANQLLYFARVNNAKVLIDSKWNLAAKFLEQQGGCSQLAYLVDLELFSLSFHFFEENGQVLWDLVRAHEIGSVFTSVKFLAKVFAHLVDLADGSREVEVRLFNILKANAAQHFKLLISALLVASFLVFGQLDRFQVFPVTDPL